MSPEARRGWTDGWNDELADRPSGPWTGSVEYLDAYQQGRVAARWTLRDRR